jgi:hypothetical protein
VFALSTTIPNGATTTMTGSRTSGTIASIDASGNVQLIAAGIYSIDVVLSISGAVTTGRTFVGVQTGATPQARGAASVGDDTYSTSVAALVAAATSTFIVNTFQTSGSARTVTGTLRVTKVK